MQYENLPHFDSCVRLKPSPIHGIGVFAVRFIPKDTKLFPDDEQAELVEVSEYRVSVCAPEIQKLYKDFCPRKNGKYLCPKSFNNLTVGWYLNHSKEPNCRADEHYNFYPIRDILSGEELTVDYDSYSPMISE